MFRFFSFEWYLKERPVWISLWSCKHFCWVSTTCVLTNFEVGVLSGKSLPYRLLFWSCSCREINVRKLSEGFHGRVRWHLFTKSLNKLLLCNCTYSVIFQSVTGSKMCVPRWSGQDCPCSAECEGYLLSSPCWVSGILYSPRTKSGLGQIYVL